MWDLSFHVASSGRRWPSCESRMDSFFFASTSDAAQRRTPPPRSDAHDDLFVFLSDDAVDLFEGPFPYRRLWHGGAFVMENHFVPKKTPKRCDGRTNV